MKKISILLAAISILFIAGSCHKDNVPDKEKNYLDYVLTDYKALVAAYPEAKDRFVEARFTLDNIIADTPADQIKAKTLTTICYVWLNGHSEIYVCERDFDADKAELYSYTADSPWFGDSQIAESALESLKYSLEDAIAFAKKEAGGGDGVSTANVTLRKPIYPFWDNPQYVFGGSGGRHDHVFVDSNTGKVSIEEMPVPEGSAMSFLIDDYNRIIDLYKNFDQMEYPIELQGKLVQIQYELNNALNAELASELEPVKATYVFYYPAADGIPSYLIRCTRDSFKMGSSLSSFSEEVLSAPWTEGLFIDPDYIDSVIALEDAIFAVKLGNVTDTDTNLVTLCQPKEFQRPVMEFKGDKVPSVYVDAVYGEIVSPD